MRIECESTTTTNLRIPFDRDCNPYLRVVASKKYAMQGRIAGVRRRLIASRIKTSH